MNASGQTTEISSIEELTIYSLEHSQEGLESLISSARSCATELRLDEKAGLATLPPLVEAIRDFVSFTDNLQQLFQVDEALINDRSGNLTLSKAALLDNMMSIELMLNTRDISGLADTLFTQLPATLERFKDLLPLLGQHINDLYITQDEKHA